MFEAGLFPMPRYRARKPDILTKTNPSAKNRIHTGGRLGLEAFMGAAVYCEEPARVQPAKNGMHADNQLGLGAFVNAAIYCEEPARVQSAITYTHADNRLGLDAFMNAAVYSEEPARVSLSAAWKKDGEDRYRPPGASWSSLSDKSYTTVPSGTLLGWSIIIGYLIAGGTSYFAFLEGLSGGACALLFFLLGGLFSLGLCYAAHAVFGDEIAETKGLEQRAAAGVESEAADFSKLIVETLDAIRDQPAPDPAILALKRNSLKTLLDMIELRLEHMEKVGVNNERESQQLKSVCDQLNAALSLTDRQEMPHADQGNAMTSNRRKRVA